MNFCTENLIKIYQFIGYIFLIFKYLLPFILIIYGIFDLFKSVISNEDKILKKQVIIFLKRIMVGVFILFLPTIILLVFEMMGNSNQNSCIYKCVLNVKKCNYITVNNGNKENIKESNCTVENEECIDNSIIYEG